MRRSPLLLVTVLLHVMLVLTGPPAHAQASEADGAFEPIQRRFGVLYQSLTNTRGFTEEDRPTLEAFQQEVEAFAARYPQHVRAAAMAVQLARWLGQDQSQIEALYERLSALQPGDSSIALSWLQYLAQNPETDPDELLTAFEKVGERFPRDEEVLTGWTTRLKKQARYDRIIELLRPMSAELEAMPELMYTLADSLFAENQFDEALQVLRGIPESAGDDSPRLRVDLRRFTPYFEEYIDLWSAERALREAEQAADDLPRVELTTPRGRVVLELFENDAPNTVANFVSLVEDGFYDGTRFHRLEPDFMIQGGDPNTKPEGEGTPGQGGPGYVIPDEHTGESFRKHFGDSVAMAKTSAPNTAGSQFYLNHRPTAWLNGKHTVFGRVIEGREVVRRLRQDDEIISAKVLRKRDHPYEPSTLPEAADAG